MASTELDPQVGYRVHPKVALRPEPFGALAYHYGNRRLTFIRSVELLELVRSLENHSTLNDALAASTIAEERWPAMTNALGSLFKSEFIDAG